MNYKILFILFLFVEIKKSYAGVMEVPSTFFKYTANLVTTGGKGCARCGTPYNVWCMDSYGNNKMMYNKPIESCFQITAGGCRPKDGAMEEARKYCASFGLILNEAQAGKQEQARGVANAQIKSTQKAINNAMPSATLALGAVASFSGVPGQALQGAISASTAMQEQNLNKKALKSQNKAFSQNVASIPLDQKNLSFSNEVENHSGQFVPYS
ncbi:hypothetical protein P618_200299 [Holospora obtusa F1]|uniref:Uncharacterized protein n=1 Tax=Holospora obtusa F1 TaxID=1399147 RepID=W6THS5_HOLOB|nr:hypothetical protein [Holospora obtusa]ETZ07510.1 hypothetical protein P618_200299 [Holospora obtusa F1]